MSSFKIVNIIPVEDTEVRKILEEHWGSTTIIAMDRVHTIEDLSGFVAIQKNMAAGLITYEIRKNTCEIVTLNSLIPRIGVGSELVSRCIKLAREENCEKIWVSTTNDNTDAMKFYQKRGFRFRQIYPDKIDEYRLKKPEIPLIGMNDIPMKDEIVFDMVLHS
ncbi:MAG: N-acetyltransferase [Melioribacteraceae bacterium]|nr:MAG: N-acetyltransferase [Melioribacteraceae bacterium]